MSVERLEMIKQQIVTLSRQELAELSRFLAEQIKLDRANTQTAIAASDSEDDAEHRRKQHLEWLKANSAQYGGQYVALDGDRLVATGKNYPEAAEAAKRAGVARAFVTYVYPPGYVGEMGGWS